MSDLVKRLRIKAGMIEMGERIAWGSDTALMREAADALELAAPAVQGEPVGWVNSDELDNMLDDRTATLFPVRTGFHGKPLYTAAQPAEQQPDVQGYVMVPAKEFESVLNRADWRTAKNRAELRHMLKALQSSAAPDVAGLVEALERSVAGFDALSGMASLDAGARNYARQKAIELNAILAAHRKQQEGQP